MIELHHNAFSTCSQKVRLVLSHKGLDWISHEIDLMAGENTTDEYLKINPKAQVPVLVHHDSVIFESTIINEYLDDAFPDSPVKPVIPHERARMRLWTKEIDDRVHAAIGAITYASVIRAVQLQRPKEDVLAEFDKIVDPAIKNLKISTFELGVEAPAFQSAVSTTLDFLGKLTECLGKNEWLAGSEFSLAEASVIPYVTRLEHLGMDFLWQEEPSRPLKEWISRVQSELSFKTAVLDYFPAETLAMLKVGGSSAAQRVRDNLQPG